MPEPPQRVVSLIASATEMVCALGCEGRLVGRSHECDFPPSVARLPVCTEPRFDTSGTSRDVDQRVKAIVRDALSVYRVDIEMLRRLQPDVIVTQAHCEVCAVSERDVEAATRSWPGSRPRIVSLRPNALSDVWRGLRQVAEALGIPERGERPAQRLCERMASIAERAVGLAARPSVVCIEWIDPLMAAGNWMPELVAMAGGVNGFGQSGRHSPWLTWDALLAYDPDLTVVMPCGFDVPRTRSEMPALSRQPGWSSLRAARDRRVVVADGNQYFNRPGPRLAESLEILAEVIHPEIFHFGHEGRGWEYFSAAPGPSSCVLRRF